VYSWLCFDYFRLNLKDINRDVEELIRIGDSLYVVTKTYVNL
jgi:hypothetical protein